MATFVDENSYRQMIKNLVDIRDYINNDKILEAYDIISNNTFPCISLGSHHILYNAENQLHELVQLLTNFKNEMLKRKRNLYYQIDTVLDIEDYDNVEDEITSQKKESQKGTYYVDENHVIRKKTEETEGSKDNSD